VLAAAWLLSLAAWAGLDQLLRLRRDAHGASERWRARAAHYHSPLRQALSVAIAAAAIVALLEVWGVDALKWFASGELGGRVLAALGTVAIASMAAAFAWEGGNALIDAQLARLAREERYARTSRLRTLLPMLRAVLMSAILAVVGLTALGEIGVNIAPLLAGAGVVGVAVGFGSQKLVQDVITGLFLLVENGMQVGEFVTVGGLSGTVEKLTIRTVQLRGGDGSLHIIPYGSVSAVTNTNRGLGNASISVNVAYKEDTDRVEELLQEIATQMRKDPKFATLIRGRSRGVGGRQGRCFHGDDSGPNRVYRFRTLGRAAGIQQTHEEAVSRIGHRDCQPDPAPPGAGGLRHGRGQSHYTELTVGT
jgi:moderate conductance mechanosensitive channel